MSTPYEDGRTACALGARYDANPYPPSANCRAWNEGWKAEWERQAERDKADAADQRLRDVVAAIELLITAKIDCAKADPELSLSLEGVREQLADKLAEWLAEK